MRLCQKSYEKNEKILDEADAAAEKTNVRLTHKEVFESVKKKILDVSREEK